MNLKAMKNVITSKAGRQLLRVQKDAPTLLFAAGIVGFAATVVVAARATLKVEEILEDHETTKDKIQRAFIGVGEYTEQDMRKDKVILHLQTTGKLFRVYAPAIVLGVLSVTALTGSHVTLTRRNMAITAAYAALEKGFREYRERLIAEMGEDKDREFRYGYEDREIVVETETGPQTTIVRTANPNSHSVYARFFDELNKNYKKQPEYNLLFLKAQQNYANDMLHARGHVFLNEVYDLLGMDRSRAGAVVGWVLGEGDSFVDFGIWDRSNDRAIDFVNGREGAILLDFNVAGVIYDKI